MRCCPTGSVQDSPHTPKEPTAPQHDKLTTQHPSASPQHPPHSSSCFPLHSPLLPLPHIPAQSLTSAALSSSHLPEDAPRGSSPPPTWLSVLPLAWPPLLLGCPDPTPGMHWKRGRLGHCLSGGGEGVSRRGGEGVQGGASAPLAEMQHPQRIAKMYHTDTFNIYICHNV